MSRFPRGLSEEQLRSELVNITMGASMEYRKEYITRVMLEYRLEKIMRIRVEKFSQYEWLLDTLRSGEKPKVVPALPAPMLRQVELLSHLDNGTELKGVGYKVTDKIFYLD